MGITISGANLLTIFGAAGSTSTITIHSGAGPTTINSNIQLSGLSQGITVENTAGLVINGVVDGTIGLTKLGTGILYLSNANTYQGGTILTDSLGDSNAGTVKIGNNASFGAGAITVNGTSIFSTDGGSYNVANNILLNAGLETQVAASTLQLSGLISGVDGVTKTGAGTLYLTSANTYSGGTSFNGGTVEIGVSSIELPMPLSLDPLAPD